MQNISKQPEVYSQKSSRALRQEKSQLRQYEDILLIGNCNKTC